MPVAGQFKDVTTVSSGNMKSLSATSEHVRDLEL